jgi:hypothetical protein
MNGLFGGGPRRSLIFDQRLQINQNYTSDLYMVLPHEISWFLHGFEPMKRIVLKAMRYVSLDKWMF